MRSFLRPVLASALVGMGVLHFVPGPARGMAAMIPPSMVHAPATAAGLVRFTGVCEMAGGVGLLVPRTRRAAAVALVGFLAAVFPANARAAGDPERFGPLAIPLLPRLLGQLGLAALVVIAGGPWRRR